MLQSILIYKFETLLKVAGPAQSDIIEKTMTVNQNQIIDVDSPRVLLPRASIDLFFLVDDVRQNLL